MIKKAIDIHENFACYLAFKNTILWDAYTPSQFSLFKQKLNKLYQNDANCSLETKRAIEKNREAIYKSSIAQAKYTNNNLLSTFILVTVAEGDYFLQARDATKFSVHLVVRTRRCMKNDNSNKCCMIFIDEHGRVYQNWKSYIEDNQLPEGIALAPTRGCYTYENGKLSMDSWLTPASKLNRKLLATADAAAGIGAFAATGITIATLALPVAAPLVAAAGFLTVSTGVYTATRSARQLKDRREHEQSIGLGDSQSRECWLGVITGVLASSSSAVNKAIKSAAVGGRQITLLEESMVKGMHLTTMLISGTGVVNGVAHIIIKIADDQEATATDWLEIASCLAIFTHSVYNYRIASNIMSQRRNVRSHSFKNKLREISAKITTSTTSTHGNVDSIRLANMIPDNYLAIANRIDMTYRLYKNIEKFVLNEDSFNNCYQSICKVVGSLVTEYLVDKTLEFFEKFRPMVEKYIRTTLFFETALWDLYQKCEEYIIRITIQNLDENIEKVFRQLLEHYKQMTWISKGYYYSCNQCGGFYSVTK